ncbi:MAG: 3-oxoacyl-ACP synthase [Sulfurimonas sp.]|nr:3-oxoacyl-ACP synthase [Sulfurimonas sp.]
MTKVYISDYEVLSSQGDLSQTIDAIKNKNIKISKKIITTDIQTIDAPYFLFKDEIKENKDEIYGAIRDIALKIISKLDVDERKSTALIIGTAIVDLNIAHAIESCVYEDERTEYSSKKYSIDSYAKAIANEFGLNDFTMSINTACTSSANAMLEGANFINGGIFEKVLVIGVEIYSAMMSSGFSAMNLLSLESQKPFDNNRDGLILGEGLAAVLLTKQYAPWSLMGGFCNCNSINITSVSEDGGEYVEVMRNALKNANISVKDITALKTHGTSTIASDLSEINAMKVVFESGVVFSALKPYIGHTIGACGTLELAIFLSSIDNGFIPSTLSCSNPMLKKYTPLSTHKECNNGVFMLNYFGFGGNNTSVIVKKEQV